MPDWTPEGKGMPRLHTLVDLSPEAVLEDLLGLLEALVVLEGVQVRQHAHHLGEAVHLQSMAKLSVLELGGGQAAQAAAQALCSRVWCCLSSTLAAPISKPMFWGLACMRHRCSCQGKQLCQASPLKGRPGVVTGVESCAAAPHETGSVISFDHA